MLRSCVDSIRKQSMAARGIIIFDNGSPQPLRIEGARVIRSEKNIGFSAGVNDPFALYSAGFASTSDTLPDSPRQYRWPSA